MANNYNEWDVLRQIQQTNPQKTKQKQKPKIISKTPKLVPKILQEGGDEEDDDCQ